MRIMILGADGYLGWPTSMALSMRGHEIYAVDNYLRRNIARETDSEPLVACPNLNERAELFASASGKKIHAAIVDCTDFRRLERLVEEFQPEAVVHYAEQPSAPYSMIGYLEAQRTLQNNIGSTFNITWSILKHVPDCHLIKLGTMGEYGTPNIDIEEGWLDVEHHGRKQTFLYPRQAGSLYHTTKVLDTDLLWFYVRTYGMRVTDLMQGPVYGCDSGESFADDRLISHFHYDDIFGTVVNRFLVQAVARVPLTVYGKGGQTRGYLNLKDTLQCIEIAIRNPAKVGELRILNQFTEQFTVNELARRIQAAAKIIGITVDINSIPNPRIELEEHYYNARHSALIELGLSPNLMSEEVLVEMLEWIRSHRDAINLKKIQPRVSWSK